MIRYFSILAIAIAISMATQSQDSIPNADFENWYSASSPAHWTSTNDLLPAGFITCTQSNIAHTGDHAIQLKTINMEGSAIPGVLSLGVVGMGYTDGGISFSERPESLNGYIVHPSNGDNVMIVAQFYKNGIEIGSAFWSTTDSLPDYTPFTAPAVFQTSENPDTLNITILTDQFIIGSTLIVDALHFEFPVTSTTSKTARDIQVYPNPCSTQLFMNLPPNVPVEASLYDMNGRLSIKSTNEARELNTSRLKPGVYTLIMESGTEVIRKKIIKQ